MSTKQKARMAAKQAVGQTAKVNKIHGQLIVFRTETKGRECDWRRMVKQAVKAVLADWQVTDENQGVVVFSMVKS